MGVFDRSLKKLANTFQDPVQVKTPDGPVHIDPTAIEVLRYKSERLTISASPSTIEVATTRIILQSMRGELSTKLNECRLNLSFVATASPVSNLNFYGPRSGHIQHVVSEIETASSVPHASTASTATPITVALVWPKDAKEVQVHFSQFQVASNGFSFPINEDVKPSQPTNRSTGGETSSPRLQPIKPPAPPQHSAKIDLRERLRQILSPPIHELLSDPQLALPQSPFPYQLYGIKWLYDRDSALLADEMGLGKTMQAILAARLLFRDQKIKHILIICPKSLIPNWCKELRQWWTGIESFTKVVDKDRQRFLGAETHCAVKIINYESLQRELEWVKKERPHHDLVIIDEAQRIKNRKSRTSQAVKALSATRRWALTGTPLENKPDDIVSIFDFVCPNLFREAKLANPIEIQNSQAQLASIREIIKPHMLRRKQEEVLKELPERIEQDVEIELGPEHQRVYDQFESRELAKLAALGDRVTRLDGWALLCKLRQVCNFNPKDGESAKAKFLIEELEEIVESGRKALIFGEFVKETYGLKRLQRVLSAAEFFRGRHKAVELLSGETPDHERQSMVKRFQTDPQFHVLLLNYKVGGVGLNLQAASYVFLFDRWWNPAVEDQAVMRAHRIGQKRTVIVKRLYCRKTIEERMVARLLEKRKMFNKVVESSRSVKDDFLTRDEIFALLGLNLPKRS